MIGRQALAREAGLGEGAARTVLKKLRDGGYAEVDASGAHLTGKGRAGYSLLLKELSPIVALRGSGLTVGRKQAAIGVRGRARRLGKGIEQRDSAVLAGATGATTYTIEAGRFVILGESNDCERDFPSKAWRLVREGVHPKNGDAVILCGADDETTAKLGVLSAALTLL
jgi:hypothetical protein